MPLALILKVKRTLPVGSSASFATHLYGLSAAFTLTLGLSFLASSEAAFISASFLALTGLAAAALVPNQTPFQPVSEDVVRGVCVPGFVLAPHALVIGTIGVP